MTFVVKAYLGEQHGKSHDVVLRQLILIVDLSLPLFGGENLSGQLKST